MAERFSKYDSQTGEFTKGHPPKGPKSITQHAVLAFGIVFVMLVRLLTYAISFATAAFWLLVFFVVGYVVIGAVFG